LYASSGGAEHQLWEPGFLSDQADVKSLYLDKNGISINSVYTKTDAVIDTQGAHVIGGITIESDDVYKTFLAQLSQMKASGTIADYVTFPYDWRMTPADVVTKGVQYDDGTHYLDQKLIALASTSKTGKVTIVAHSNGGLVAKELMFKLQSEGKSNLVDKIVLVDVPQIGTPETIAAMLHGDFQDIPAKTGFMASQANARGLSENMPDAYDLLPSATYFSKVATPVVDLSDAPTLKSTSGVISSTITNSSNFANFLTGAGGRKKPSYLDIETPDVLSAILLSNAAQLHAKVDSWQPPTGVQVIQIAGWGIDTPSEVTYSEQSVAQCQSGSCAIVPVTRHVVNMTEDGDGVVVVPSEVATTTWPTYYINIPEYNHANGLNINHADITESQPLQSLFSLLLSSNSPKSLPNYVTTTQPNPTVEENSLRLRVLSPVTMDVYDVLGNHTGMTPNPNSQSDDLYVEEQIPGSYYQQYGEGQYIGLPVNGTYTVKLHGTGTGIFTFEITPVSAGVAGTPVTFDGIPVTASSTAMIKLTSTNPTATSLVVDENGDGKADISIASSAQLSDPIAYTKMMFTSILSMDIGPIVKIQLEAKIMNVGYLIAKSTLWNNDDSDPKDTNIKDTGKTHALKKLNQIEMYVENEVSKPAPKLLKTEQISSAQGNQILGMIEELKSMISIGFK
jgi:pimeloyl-ACP methyl ester carboxylesterase